MHNQCTSADHLIMDLTRVFAPPLILMGGPIKEKLAALWREVSSTLGLSSAQLNKCRCSGLLIKLGGKCLHRCRPLQGGKVQGRPQERIPHLLCAQEESALYPKATGMGSGPPCMTDRVGVLKGSSHKPL